MNVGNRPEDLPQFEDRFLYHLVDIACDRQMGHLDGVPEKDVAVRTADELEVSSEFIESHGYHASRSPSTSS